jgi:hypothetical protein
MLPSKLVENRWRGDLVEEFVHAALGPDGWSLSSGDWNSWDMKHGASGLKLQVKQTARLQTWGASPSTNRYSIKPAKGFYEGSSWCGLTAPQRLSEIYVFARHPIDGETADHWDVSQWQFHAVTEDSLPSAAKSISISDVTRLAAPVGINALAHAVGAWPP